jgi:alkyl hydroperoxide reductase subunit AhpF
MGTHPLYNQTGLQKNNKTHVMYALTNKQIELKQLEDEYEAKIAKIKSDLAAMEQVICLFDGDCGKTIEKINTHTDNKRARAKPKSLFGHGELKSLVLKTLRTSSNPLKTDDIALEVIEIKELELTDEIVSKVQKAISHQTRVLEKEGLITPVGKEGLNFLWEIKP